MALLCFWGPGRLYARPRMELNNAMELVRPVGPFLQCRRKMLTETLHQGPVVAPGLAILARLERIEQGACSPLWVCLCKCRQSCHSKYMAGYGNTASLIAICAVNCVGRVWYEESRGSRQEPD